MTLMRFQTPTYAPITLQAIWSAAVGAGYAPAESLSGLLRSEYAADEVILCGSGTDALQVALGLVRNQTGTRPLVALPAFTCFEVAAAAVGSDVRVVLYDVDPATMAPDLDSFARAVRGGADAAVVSPLFGIPVNWQEVEAIARSHGVILLEDAAQGHGGSWHGSPLGSLGDASILSFGRGKGWSGIRGGALLLRRPMANAGVADSLKICSLRDEATVGLSALAQWLLARPGVYRLPRSLPFLKLGETRSHDPVAARALTRTAAELVTRSRTAAAREAAVRRVNAAFYLDALEGVEHLRTYAAPPGGIAGYIRMPLSLPGGTAALGMAPAAFGIEAGYPATLGELTQLRSSLVSSGRPWLGAEELSRNLVTLPTHSRLSRAERGRVVDVVRTRAH
jgi:dTDP-4-amino-4,6-dideoxygalactose transaminase